MSSHLEQRQNTAGPAAEPTKGDTMAPEGIENARKAITDYFESAKRLSRECTTANAKLACEKSRTAWLTMFPYRGVFVSQFRDLVGDFVQSLDDVTARIADADVGAATDEDLEYRRHYLDNMRGRA